MTRPADQPQASREPYVLLLDEPKVREPLGLEGWDQRRRHRMVTLVEHPFAVAHVRIPGFSTGGTS
jgi:hypothetical protein